jgi:hypothetical protein
LRLEAGLARLPFLRFHRALRGVDAEGFGASALARFGFAALALAGLALFVIVCSRLSESEWEYA